LDESFISVREIMVDLFELGTLKRQKQALIDLEEIINSENFDPRELYLNLKIM